MAVADYADYVNCLRSATLSLREFAKRDRAPSAHLLEVADRLYAITEKLSPTVPLVSTLPKVGPAPSD